MTTSVMQLGHGENCRPATATGFRPWFRADWRDVVFVHYAIDPAALQPHVPYELDLFGGEAWVSLVAFTQSGMRPAFGGAVGAAAMKPVATHAFLNLRTYVRPEGHRAILFLAEWIPNRLAMLVGPRLYGLPFRMGRLAYGEHRRDVMAGGAALRLTATAHGPEYEAARGSADEFLLERYTAYTCRDGRGRAFHIAHDPWVWRRAAVAVEDDRLIRQAAPWFAEARPACAHVSDGAFDVGIGGPARVATTYDAPLLPAGGVGMAPGCRSFGPVSFHPPYRITPCPRRSCSGGNLRTPCAGC